MELISREMPKKYEIIDTGDWHCGVANTNESAIFEMIEYVATNKDVFLVLKGDLIDAIISGDKRFSLTSFKGNEVTTPHQQAKRVADILMPVKDRILFMQMGNHEYKLLPTFDCLDYWSETLGCPWGGIAAKFVHLKKGIPQWKGFFCHGNGSIKSQAKDPIQAMANMRALLKQKLKGLASDCVYMSMAHTHNMLLVNPTIQNNLHLIDDGTSIKQTYRVDVNQASQYIDVEARWYGCSGAYLSTMSQPGERVIPYSEMAMYTPTEHGYLKLKVEGHRLGWVDRVVV